MRGQVAGRLGQLGGLLLLGNQGLFLGFQRFALLGQGSGFVRLDRADDLELVVELFHFGGAQCTQRIGLALNLHSAQAQLRQQVVVSLTGDALADLVQPLAQLLDAGVFIQHWCFGNRQVGQWRGRGRPGWAGNGQHQGQQDHQAWAITGKADTPHRIFLFTIRFGGGFYAASGRQESAVSRFSNCCLRSTPQR
ncbi:hypothetical protein D9M71_477150 [compost metagenome]